LLGLTKGTKIAFCIPILLFLSCSDSDSNSDSPQNGGPIEIASEIVSDVTLSPDNEYLLVGQTFLKSGATMTILPGTTIEALPADQVGAAPVLVVEPGAKLIADGTREQPITFTSAADPSTLPRRGLWGGIVILGNAPINQAGGRATVEGLPGIFFGGDDPQDNSGILRYVRIWYGGRAIGQGNEINGLTMAGVGAGTTVEHCEVAWNLDDGFEFFGGTVNFRYLSAIFCGDDSFDMDWGYQGKGQFLFSLSGQDTCGRGFEIDNDGRQMDAQPRTSPVLSNVTLIGPNGGDPGGDGTDQMMRLREGTGGFFTNIIAINGNGSGLRITNDPTLALVTTIRPESFHSDALYFSGSNILFNNQGGAFHNGAPEILSAIEANPLLQLLEQGSMGYLQIDPRLSAESPYLQLSERLIGDDFLQDVSYIGAFDQETNWLKGWSWLDEAGFLP
jgi:hypothetical protein